MLLKTFGEANLYDDAGNPIDRFVAQRRLVGLIAVLAAGPAGGLSRDKLVGLLWPDSTPERARHSLTQALYSARKATGCDDLFVGTESIRLNSDFLWADVRAFDDAIARQDWVAAAELYRGPFLDGLYLQSNEFEDWTTRERTRLEEAAALALNGLVEALETRGDIQPALEYSKRLVTLRATDTGFAARHSHLLRRSGDRAAAAAYVQAFITFMREQHGVEVDAGVFEAAESDQPAPDRATVERTDAHEAAPVQRRRPSWKIAGIAVVTLSLLVTLLLWRSRGPGPAPSVAPVNELLIAPFRVTSTDQQLRYLSQGMIELLATRFADANDARSFDAGRMLRLWRDVGIEGGTTSADSLLHVAARTGVERLITGNIVGNAKRIVLNASLLRVPSGATLSKASVEGSPDSLIALVDALTRRLLVHQLNSDEDNLDRGTLSLAALRAYIDANAAFAAGDYAIAAPRFERALRIDSTFALAAMQLTFTRLQLGEFDDARSALASAWAHRSNLGERNRLLLTALAGPRFPSVSSLDERMAMWTRAARAFPERAEPWYGLAQARAAARAHGYPFSLETVLGPLQRSLELDSLLAQAQALAQHVEGEFQYSNARLAASGPAELRRNLLRSFLGLGDMSAAAAAVSELRSRATTSSARTQAILAAHALATLRGQTPAATAAIQTLQRTLPTSGAYLRLRVLDALYGDGDTLAARQAVRELEGLVESESEKTADACVVGLWQSTKAQTAAARKTALLLDDAGVTRPASVPGTVCRLLIDVTVAVSENRPEGLALVMRLDSLDFNSLSAGDASTFAPIVLARSFLSLREAARAKRVLQRYMFIDTAWPRYHANALLLLGETALKLDERALAHSALEAFVRIREDAAPELKQQVATARAVLQSISQ